MSFLFSFKLANTPVQYLMLSDSHWTWEHGSVFDMLSTLIEFLFFLPPYFVCCSVPVFYICFLSMKGLIVILNYTWFPGTGRPFFSNMYIQNKNKAQKEMSGIIRQNNVIYTDKKETHQVAYVKWYSQLSKYSFLVTNWFSFLLALEQQGLESCCFFF